MAYSAICKSAAVLTGGASRRMGRDKMYVEVGGRPMLSRVLGTITPLFDDVMIVGRRVSGAWVPTGVRFVPDEIKGKGPLGGLYSSLLASESEAVFLVACDMPFLDSQIVCRLLDAVQPSADAVVCRCGDFVEPLHAVYSRRLRSRVRALLQANSLSIQSLIGSVQTLQVDMDPGLPAFFNVNEPADLSLARIQSRQLLSSCRCGLTKAPSYISQ